MGNNPFSMYLGRSPTEIRPVEPRTQQVSNGSIPSFMADYEDSRANVAIDPHRFENNIRTILQALA